MNLEIAKLRFATLGVVLACLMAGFLGCSGDSKVAGNSAETGSPELASIEGHLYLKGKKPAARARVVVVPRQFDVFDDSVLIQENADEKGFYSLKGVEPGEYTLEALAESGERLLVQNVVVPELDSSVVEISDTLKVPGFALLKMDSGLKDGLKGVATAIGTTIYRNVEVVKGFVLVDSLPEGSLDLRISLGKGSEYYYDRLGVSSGDTVKIGFVVDSPDVDTVEVDSVAEDTSAALDTLVMRFVAPMALPEGFDDSLVNFVSDIPLALRLTPENCNFDTLAGMEGRWEVRRIKTDGGASKKLPIASGYFDSLAQEAVFWVRVDSLNLDDSLELTFDNTMSAGFARDVFPTNRAYAAVWHFDDGLTPVSDAAEKQNFPGLASGVKLVDGVVGSGAAMSKDGFVIVENSAAGNSSLQDDLVYDMPDLFSFSLWIRLESLDKEQTIFEKGDREYSLRFNPDDGFVVEIFHVATEVASDSGAQDTVNYSASWLSGTEGLAAGEWIYLAFSKHGFSRAGNGLGTLFVNDRKVESFEKSRWDGVRGSASDFRLGGFVGDLDEFVIGGAARDDFWNYITYLNQKPTDYWPVIR